MDEFQFIASDFASKAGKTDKEEQYLMLIAHVSPESYVSLKMMLLDGDLSRKMWGVSLYCTDITPASAMNVVKWFHGTRSEGFIEFPFWFVQDRHFRVTAVGMGVYGIFNTASFRGTITDKLAYELAICLLSLAERGTLPTPEWRARLDEYLSECFTCNPQLVY